MIDAFRKLICLLVRRNVAPLSTHQLAVFLTCYTGAADHTVRGLAKDLHVSKSVVTRALDRLGELDLSRRKVDPRDRRSIIVEQTQPGHTLIEQLLATTAVAALEPVLV